MRTLSRAARARLEKIQNALEALDNTVDALSAAHAGNYTAQLQYMAEPTDSYRLMQILDQRLLDVANELRDALDMPCDAGNTGGHA